MQALESGFEHDFEAWGVLQQTGARIRLLCYRVHISRCDQSPIRESF